MNNSSNAVSLETYTNNYLNVQNLKTFYFKLKSQLFDDAKTIKQDMNDTSTNFRKTYYQQQAIQTVSAFYTGFLIVYGIAAFATILTLLRNSDTSKAKLVIIGVLLIILPFITTPISILLLIIWNWLLNLFPKNVYFS